MSSYPAISVSDFSSFKRCRRKWDYSSRHRKHLTSRKPQKALYLGSGVHNALEAYYGKSEEDPVEVFVKWAKREKQDIIDAQPEDLWQDEIDELDEAIELGKGMLEHYIQWSSENDSEYFDDTLMVEQPFLVPVYTPKDNRAHCNFYGIIDGLVQDEYGAYWVHEFKTAKQLGSRNLTLDEQAVGYMYAAKELWGIDCAGIMYTILRKKIPTIPKELKNGDISIAKNIATTYEVYHNKLIDYYGSEEEIPGDRYEEILTILKEQDNPFFKREKVRKTDKEVENFGRRLYDMYRDMFPHPRIYPNPTRDCRWDCPFQEVCEQQSEGADYTRTLEHRFEESTREREVDKALTVDNADVDQLQ